MEPRQLKLFIEEQVLTKSNYHDRKHRVAGDRSRPRGRVRSFKSNYQNQPNMVADWKDIRNS